MIRALLLIRVFTSLLSIARAGEPAELSAAKKEYEQSSKNEAARLHLVGRLAKLADGFIAEYRSSGSRAHGDDLQAIYGELKKHPAPKDADSKTLSRTLVGKWDSPRHSYQFKADGTWTMLPAEKDATHGKWRIEGNQYVDTAAVTPATTSRYTLILLDDRHFVFMDKDVVFIESRQK